MALNPIRLVTGTGISVPGDDIDTDRIIPARYLRCVTFDGLGPYAFYDDRYAADGTPRPHPMNDERFVGASILFSGRNFGCGSSREHAPQSLHKAGFRAIVAPSFAEIFFGNCTGLGVPCVTLGAAAIREAAAAVEGDPSVSVAVDLETMQLTVDARSWAVDMPHAARASLLAGEWDPLGQLLEAAEAVETTWTRLPYRAWASGTQNS